NEDTQKTITLNGTDANGDTLSFKVMSLPSSGKLYDGTGTAGHQIVSTDLPYTVADGTHNVTYNPDANYNGADSFTFKVNDSTVDSASAATVSITVNPVNDAPVAVDDSYSVNEDSTLAVLAPGVLVNDTDVD